MDQRNVERRIQSPSPTRTLACLLMGALIGGCGSSGPAPTTVSMSDFASGANPANPTTQLSAPAPAPAPVPSAPAPINPISSLVQEQIRPTTTPGISSGQFMILGGVVAEANGQPIYANKVLKLLSTALATKAKEMDPRQFRLFAADLIKKQVNEFIRAELEYASAQRNLDQQDKDLAEGLTMLWRTRQITDSGGSVEVARRRAQADGNDFEELVQQQYRMFMTQVFYQKKVIPKIQVTASDMRKYYQHNLEAEFTDHAQARFRLLKVSVRESGGREPALKKIQDLYARAKSGEDFTKLASTVNDDADLKRRGGDVGVIDKGAFASEKVENAVWELQPGQITEPIDLGTAFALGRMEEMKVGKVKSFDDPAVQEQIRSKMRSDQFRLMRDQIQATLEKNAVIRWDPTLINTAVDMAMQEYPRWSGK